MQQVSSTDRILWRCRYYNLSSRVRKTSNKLSLSSAGHKRLEKRQTEPDILDKFIRHKFIFPNKKKIFLKVFGYLTSVHQLLRLLTDARRQVSSRKPRNFADLQTFLRVEVGFLTCRQYRQRHTRPRLDFPSYGRRT